MLKYLVILFYEALELLIFYSQIVIGIWILSFGLSPLDSIDE